MADFGSLQQTLGYQFQDPLILKLALTHRSAGGENNERLEFLGDSILNHIVAAFIFHRFTRVREGEMSRMRSQIVKGATLAAVAEELKLGDYLLLGSGERKSGGHRRASIRADALEAVIGAILVDGGFEACRECVLRLFDARLAKLQAGMSNKDDKTQLQEYLQGRGLALPRYELLSVEGEDHARRFRVACHVETLDIATEGEASSRRKAEQAAAMAALTLLSDKRGANA